MLNTQFHTHTNTHNFRASCKRFLQVILSPKQVTMMLILMYGALSTSKGYCQAWNASTSPVFLTNPNTSVGIGTNSPQKTLHIVQTQPLLFPSQCATGNPTLRLSALPVLASSIDNCPPLTSTRINWDIEGISSRLNFAVNNTTRMVLTDIGRVGISTTDPNSLLSLGNSLNNTKLTIFQGASLTASAGIGWQTNQMRFHLDNTFGTFAFFRSEGANELVRFSGLGRNGFGTTTPLNRMDINGAMAVGNAYAGLVTAPANGMIVQGNVGIGYTTPNFPLSFGTSLLNTKIALYENNGNDAYGLGIQGGQFRFHVANSTNRFSFLSAANAPNGSEVMNIFGDGRVGIGTLNISTGIKLQVNGGGIGQVTTGVIGNALDTWSTITEGSNINIPQNQFTFNAGNTQGTIYGLNSNKNHSILSLGVLNDQNNGLSNPIIFSRGQSGRALLFGTLDANSNFREQMSLRNDGTLIVSGTPAQGLGSKLEAYGGNITQVSSGSPGGQTPTDIFTSIGGRLGNQPPPQASGINAQGLRVQWGQNGANFGMTDFDDPNQPTIKNGLISWQDLTATNLGQVKNRLLIGFRDATSAAGGNLPNFKEVATFIADGKGILGVGTKTPASFISSGNNMSVGTTFGNIGAPLNGLIVEGRVGIGTFNPTAAFASGTVDPALTPVSGPIALHVVGGGILCNSYGVGSDARIKRNVKPIESSLSLVKRLNGVNYEVNLTATTEKETWMPSSGFIAQEVKEVLPQVVMNLDNGYLALNYDAIIPVIVEALKEQQEMIEKQQQEITLLKNGENGSNRVQSLEQAIPTTKNKLEQNIPNPFSGTTVIRYSWVEGNRASLMIFDLNGTTVHKVENLTKGDQELSLELSNLASGLYYYSLVVDSAESITKRMVLNK